MIEMKELSMEEKVSRLVEDLYLEIGEARKESAKLSSKADILDQWVVKIERDILNKNHLTFP